MNTYQNVSESLSTPKQTFENDQISRMWEIFEIDSDEILELRAIWPRITGPKKKSLTKHFRREDYKSDDDCRIAFQTTALSLNKQGYNIYIVMNKIGSNFSGHSATDSDIVLRRLLLVDIDRATDTKNPASVEELETAKRIATEISNFTAELEWPKPHMVMSGNGYHLYYRLADINANSETDDLVQRTLSNLSKVFSTNDMKVDTVVSNASRITKVPGTIARKGQESIGRPYRTAQVV